jgi:hypothetical protein
MAQPVYCTVEDVKRALDQKESAHSTAQLYRAIQSSSRLIDNDCHRWFYPVTRTAYFEWPSVNYRIPWRLWLDENELVSLTSITAGGTAISTARVFLEPANLGPPYSALEIDRSTSSAFVSGSTPQRAIAVTGTFGYTNETELVGTLSVAITTTTATTAYVVNSSLIGTGDTLLIDSERMLVTQRNFTSAGQTLQTPLAASAADVTVAVTTGASFAIGETLLLDAERMLIVDISGNNLVVKRAWDGSVLATHTGSTIYAPWQLTVVRGLTGTTAATHTNGASAYRQVVPPPIRDLAIALSMDRFLQETGGYSRNIVGRGDTQRLASGGSLNGLRDQVVAQYGRMRVGSV